jgi:outer membrane receptor protein involved in Fe transport
MDIKGTIIDQKTKVPLSLVNIRSTSSPNLYTISGLNGEFKIKSDKLPIELTFSLVGYKTIQITLTNASANIIELEPYAAELNEVIVSASTDKNNDVAARNIEKYSTSIANVVSAKTIEQSPDITVANVIQRISGITLERTSNGDAQYATLRGMDKRYNFTLVNGLKIPSPDNKNRFVPLDIFPADMLARLEVIKSPTSDMEGDGIGGAINMVMKDAPNLTTFSINLSSGYNDLFFSRDFQSYNHQAIDLKSPYELNSNLYAARFRDF